MVRQLPTTMTFPDQLEHINKSSLKLAKGNPEIMKSFSELHESNLSFGALDVKTKELIALAIGVCVRCDGCIAYHTHDALKAGASPDEIYDALGVAILMGGGPSMIYATHVVDAMEQFKKDDSDVC